MLWLLMKLAQMSTNITQYPIHSVTIYPMSSSRASFAAPSARRVQDDGDAATSRQLLQPRTICLVHARLIFGVLGSVPSGVSRPGGTFLGLSRTRRCRLPSSRWMRASRRWSSYSRILAAKRFSRRVSKFWAFFRPLIRGHLQAPTNFRHKPAITSTIWRTHDDFL